MEIRYNGATFDVWENGRIIITGQQSYSEADNAYTAHRAKYPRSRNQRIEQLCADLHVYLIAREVYDQYGRIQYRYAISLYDGTLIWCKNKKEVLSTLRELKNS